MKVNTTKLIILVLLMAITQATHMKRRRIKRLNLRIKKAKCSEELIKLFVATIEKKGFEVGNKIGSGGFGMVFPIKNTNLVAKVMEFNTNKNTITNEIQTLEHKTEKLSFCVPLCNYQPIRDQGQIKGIQMFFPRAKGDLSIARNQYTKHLEENKQNKEQGLFAGFCNFCTSNQANQKITPEFDKMFHFITQMAVGLEEFHSTGLIHRDIKEANYLLFEYSSMQKQEQISENEQKLDKVVLTDFGLAIDKNDTIPRERPGTPIYVPYFDLVESDGQKGFEWKRNYNINQKFDVYSLAITIFRLLNYNVFMESIYEITHSIKEEKGAADFSFQNYKKFINLLTNNLNKQRQDCEIPEKQAELEDYLITNVFVLEEKRQSSTDIAAFLEGINKGQYQDITQNYREKIECDSFSLNQIIT